MRWHNKTKITCLKAYNWRQHNLLVRAFRYRPDSSTLTHSSSVDLHEIDKHILDTFNLENKFELKLFFKYHWKWQILDFKLYFGSSIVYHITLLYLTRYSRSVTHIQTKTMSSNITQIITKNITWLITITRFS